MIIKFEIDLCLMQLIFSTYFKWTILLLGIIIRKHKLTKINV